MKNFSNETRELIKSALEEVMSGIDKMSEVIDSCHSETFDDSLDSFIMSSFNDIADLCSFDELSGELSSWINESIEKIDKLESFKFTYSDSFGERVVTIISDNENDAEDEFNETLENNEVAS